MYLGRRTTVSGTTHVDFGGVPVTVWSPLIATIDAMQATGMESSRFRYDDPRFERYHAADRKTLQGRRVTGLVAPRLDARLHIRQEGRGGASTDTEEMWPLKSGMLKLFTCNAMTDIGASASGWSGESRELNELGRSD